ncbi:MAG: DEAD/DEAH box helicase, partial [Flavihumibacter sp.]|nr:DEAD/DEAH box helicase [Flavihumibacter sp.]
MFSINFDAPILSSPIEYLKGVGPLRADILKKELQIFTFRDLLDHFPIRHIDRTKITQLAAVSPSMEYIQVAGTIQTMQILGENRGRRLVAQLKDGTGVMELVWFQGINWIQKNIQIGQAYLVYGKTGYFNGILQLTHPEMEVYTPAKASGKAFLEPIYPSTEKLKAKSLGGRQLGKLTFTLLEALQERDLPENLPAHLLQEFQFPSRYEAYQQIHFPFSELAYQRALARLKFEELFIAQLRLGLIKLERHRYSRGVIFSQVGEQFNNFYHNHLPFALTNAQKRVLKEIRQDMAHGRQMNRLLQGDVGSGKTIVALLSMLLAVDNGFQASLMAPTEILANQHYQGLSALLKEMPVKIALLTGSTKAAARKKILKELADGELHLLVGTHALLEDPVQFRQLGLA